MGRMKELLDDPEPGGLVFAIPSHPMRQAEVDPEVWAILERVNRSGWVMAHHSCAGHWTEDGEEWIAPPHMELICQEANLTRLTRIVVDAIADAPTDAEIADAGFFIRPKSAAWWSCEIYYSGDDCGGPRPVAAERGLALLADIAERL